MGDENEVKALSGQLDLLQIQVPEMSSKINDSSSEELLRSEKLNELKKEVRKSPSTLLILDTETTGLEVDKHKCLEIGAILFDVRHRSVLAQQSFLLPVETNDAESINRIPAVITRLPQPYKEGIVFFKSLVAVADVILAHNAEFDRKWFGVGELPTISKPWICSMEDIVWPKDRNLKNRPSVRDLALAYGIPVWNAHRALTDCVYLAEVFMRCNNLDDLLAQALEPRRLVKAEISYEQRNLAKEAGFRWNDPIPRAWSRKLSDREISNLCFPVSEVEE